MARIRHLRNAPIVEALIDIRAVPREGFEPEKLREIIPKLQARYPIVEDRRGSEATFEIKQGSRLNARAKDLGLQAIFLKSEDQREVAQFRLDGFTFNRLKPYTSWESILPQTLELWAEYSALVQPKAVTRVAVRFINRIALQELGELGDLVLTGARLPQGTDGTFNGFASRLALSDNARGVSANVSQLIEVAVLETKPSLLLDIEVFRMEALEHDTLSLTDLLNRMRDYKNELFFGSLTERCVEPFE